MSKREPKLLIGDILASATKILDIRKGKHLKTSKMTVKRPMLLFAILKSW